jgi:hypothetical protein
MSELLLYKADIRKLANAYIALALAQDVAKRDLSDFAGVTRTLVSILDVTAELLEEVLEKASDGDSPPSPWETCSNLLM